MVILQEKTTMVGIDIGCGSKKKEGFIGLDYIRMPGVDYILDLETDAFPFDDNSVDAVFSSHCLEHLSNPSNIWSEISRVIRTGGQIEIWTPYPHHDDQWLSGHISGWSQSRWKHLSSQERTFYSERFLNGGFWKWREAQFVIKPETMEELVKLRIPVEFAVRHMVNIVEEWGCFFTYETIDPGEHTPNYTFSNTRQGSHLKARAKSVTRSQPTFKWPWHI